jgi:ABC-type amino acid transport substrate-binding protein
VDVAASELGERNHRRDPKPNRRTWSRWPWQNVGSSGKERLVPLRCLGHLAVACAVLVGTAPAADLAEIRASGKFRALVVMPTRNVVVNRKPAPPIASLESLKAEKVGTVKGSSMAEALAAAGVRFDDGIPSGGAPEALRSGRITATLSGIEDALLYRSSDPAIQIGVFVGDPGRLAYGVRKDAPALKRALDEYTCRTCAAPRPGAGSS